MRHPAIVAVGASIVAAGVTSIAVRSTAGSTSFASGAGAGAGVGAAAGADGAAATTIRLEYADGHSDSGRIVGMDQVTDLAVVTATTPYPAAPPITVGDSGSLRVGNPVVALGAPLGLTSTVTSGIVSAIGRYVRVPTEAGAAHLLGDGEQLDR